MTVTVLKTEQTVKAWGNGLGIRITGPLAKAAHLANGVPVTVEFDGEALIVRAAGRQQLTLADRLKLFDPVRHGGEAMVSGRVGTEIF